MKSIQWKLVLVYILLLVFALELFGVYMLSSIENYFMADLKDGLQSQVRLLSSLAERYFSPIKDPEGLQQLIREYSILIGGDVYLLDIHGVVVATSPGLEPTLGRRFVQQEVVTSIHGRSAESTRYDPDQGHRNYYYTEPVFSGGAMVGVVYVSTSLQLIDATLHQLRNILLTGAFLTLAVSAVLGLNLASTITRPLQKITSQAEAMRMGDFTQQIDIHSEDEIGRLAGTFNALSEQLQLSWDEVIQEKDKIEAILTNLSDGIIVFDHLGGVMHINTTACIWFGVTKQKMMEHGTIDSFPQLETGQGLVYLEDDLNFVLRQRRLPFLQAGKKQGTIVVLSDVTEQHRLDSMRQEFVANVSHELRTPLTSIKTYLEALIDHPDESPELRESFLNVINSETERMVRMVEDLLILSRNEARRDEFRLVSVEDIIHDIVQGIDVQVSNKNLRLNLRVAMHLPLVMGDGDQLHRLFLNIVNNALKYTSTGGITVTAGSRSNYLEVSVKDTGIGIPGDALGRIFERFFRVDKARSRKDGGSGLGMSIAKQIAEGHGGTINIASQEGKGTEVTITLPIAARKKLHLDTKAKRGAKGDR